MLHPVGNGISVLPEEVPMNAWLSEPVEFETNPATWPATFIALAFAENHPGGSGNAALPEAVPMNACCAGVEPSRVPAT
jgi:hypothetical protein